MVIRQTQPLTNYPMMQTIKKPDRLVQGTVKLGCPAARFKRGTDCNDLGMLTLLTLRRPLLVILWQLEGFPLIRGWAQTHLEQKAPNPLLTLTSLSFYSHTTFPSLFLSSLFPLLPNSLSLSQPSLPRDLLLSISLTLPSYGG